MSVRTIGEVLDLLKDEFEDVTISKIRFLEGEGLITPDRTASGYRQFRDPDIARLRYILRAQRDRYLPLKVIKEELDRLDAGAVVPEDPDPTFTTHDEPARTVRDEPSLQGDPALVQRSVNELASDTGLSPKDLRSLQDHGLLQAGDVFDEDDVRVARAAAELVKLGLEARHLRMYRQFADREAALYEQLVAPIIRQGDPDTQETALEALELLRGSGSVIHRHLLVRHLRALVQ